MSVKARIIMFYRFRLCYTLLLKLCKSICFLEAVGFSTLNPVTDILTQFAASWAGIEGRKTLSNE